MLLNLKKTKNYQEAGIEVSWFIKEKMIEKEEILPFQFSVLFPEMWGNMELYLVLQEAKQELCEWEILISYVAENQDGTWEMLCKEY